MTENELVHIALENLEKNALITGKWKPHAGNGIDGDVILNINNHNIKYNAKVKKEIRNNQLYQIINLNDKYEHFILVAAHIFPKIKEELRKNNVAYLEANGNIFLKNDNNILWIDTAKAIETEKQTGNRAFTKTGLKVLFYFLMDEQNINQTYRQIAEHTGTTIGNINKIINGLKQDGFLLPLTKTEYKITNKRELLNKWVEAYEIKLKPTLKVGTFRFVKKDDFLNWKGMTLKDRDTFWGGEAAGELYTKYLRPEILTIYTIETRTEIIKNYRLVPDNTGNVQVFEKFWNKNEMGKNVVPALLAYADLMNTGDSRCMETAQKIYDELLANQF